jgi:uncharacterized protein (DUF433 family)
MASPGFVLQSAITTNPAIHGGEPILAGTAIPVLANRIPEDLVGKRFDPGTMNYS